MINIFASNNCFSDKNIFQNCLRLFVKNRWRLFDQKLNIILIGSSDYVQNLLTCGINTYYRHLMLAFATVERKSFNGHFTAKIDFPIGHFMLLLLMQALEVLSPAIQLFDKYFGLHAKEFWTNAYGTKHTDFWAFSQKKNGKTFHSVTYIVRCNSINWMTVIFHLMVVNEFVTRLKFVKKWRTQSVLTKKLLLIFDYIMNKKK